MRTLPSLFDPYDEDTALAHQVEQYEQWLEEQFQRLELDAAFEELTTTTTNHK